MPLTIEDIRVGDELRFLPNRASTNPAYFGVTVVVRCVFNTGIDAVITDPGKSGRAVGVLLGSLTFADRFERVVKSEADLLFS